MKLLAFSVLLLLAVAFIPPGVLADGDIDFHDAIAKYYNDNGHDKIVPEATIVVTNTFSVQAQKSIYFTLEDSQDNRPISEPEGWKVRLVIRNSWNYTDFGVFGDDSPLTAPTGDYTLVPGENYTLETRIVVPLNEININDTYEVSVVLAVNSEGGYDPSESLSHYIQFAEQPPELPPITTRTGENFHFLWVIAIVGVVIVTAYIIIYKRRLKNKDDEEKD